MDNYNIQQRLYYVVDKNGIVIYRDILLSRVRFWIVDHSCEGDYYIELARNIRRVGDFIDG
jgi:hypothetical protein